MGSTLDIYTGWSSASGLRRSIVQWSDLQPLCRQITAAKPSSSVCKCCHVSTLYMAEAFSRSMMVRAVSMRVSSVMPKDYILVSFF